MRKPKIVCVFPPNFPRGPMAVGAAAALYRYGVKPEMIAGASVGALAGASVAAWEEKEVYGAVEVWSHLLPEKIARLRFADKSVFWALVANCLMHLVPDGPRPLWTRGAKVLTSLGLPAASVYALLNQPSIYSNDPLEKLLRRNLNFEKIFSPSAVKLLFASAERRTGDRVFHTNFLERDRDEDRLVTGLLSASGVPLIFEPRELDGKKLIDTVAARGDFLAIDQIEKHCPDCDYILIFLFYWLLEEGGSGGMFYNYDHYNELNVRNRIEDILRGLPDHLARKVRLVIADFPINKKDLHSFTEEDMRELIGLGYVATEEWLQKNLKDWVIQ